VTEQLLGFAPVIARVVVGCRFGEAGFVQSNSSFLDVLNQQIEYGDEAEFFKCLGKVLFEPGPGRKVGVASFRP
jgi:hypothetical protein